MAVIPDEDRTYLTEMRALTIDSNGEEVLVGLTLEETEFYLSFAKANISGSLQSAENREKYLKLHDKHKAARMGILMAENELRVDKPSRH